ncbi:MAG: methyltransferase domain-containing protein [Chloroflexi bacterium]|nr:methyltransferase domain-containing protein [Chloroflexota bacterium]
MTITRVTRTRAETRATYDRISRWYDPLEGYWESKPKQIGLQKLGVQSGEVALEIGFGTGHGIVALAQVVGELGKVYGIDLSPRMLALTQSRVNQTGLAARVMLKNGDATALPFDANFFDAIFMSFVLELFDTPEIPQVLSECRRVLKHDGRLCVVSLSKTGQATWRRNLYEWGHEKFPSLLDCRPLYVQKALEAAGLQTREATRMLLWELPVEIVVGSK